MRYLKFLNEAIYDKSPEEIFEYISKKYDLVKARKTIEQQIYLADRANNTQRSAILSKVLDKLGKEKKETKRADGVRRSTIGGQQGMNGEFYKGGAFLPSTKAGKKVTDILKGNTKGTGKVEIEPYKWEYPPKEGFRDIFKYLLPPPAMVYDKNTKQFSHGSAYKTYTEGMRFTPEGLKQQNDAMNAFNSGKRFMRFDVALNRDLKELQDFYDKMNASKDFDNRYYKEVEKKIKEIKDLLNSKERFL